MEDRRLLSAHPEHLVNTLVPRLQTSEYQSTAMRITPSGDALVVYHGRDLVDDDGVYLRRISPDGNPTSSQRVNLTTTQSQREPSIAIYPNGSYVVAWSGRGAGDHQGIFARWYTATDHPLTGEILINQVIPGIQSEPEVAVTGEGITIFVWSGSEGSTEPSGIFRRFFDFQGNALSDQHRINRTTQGTQKLPAVATNAAGRSVITWTSHDLQNNQWQVFFQPFSVTQDSIALLATPNDQQRTEHIASSRPQSNNLESRVDIDAQGRFGIVWSTFETESQSWKIYSRRFTPSGLPQQPEDSLVTSRSGTTVRHPDIALAADGRAIISWSAAREDGSGWEVYAKTYHSDGQVAEADFLVHEASGPNSGHQMHATVAIGSGPAQISWSGSGQSDRRGVWIRQTLSARQPVLNPMTPQVINEQESFRYQISARPAYPAQRVRYDLEPFSHPLGMVIDPTTGMLVWSPTELDGPGRYTAVIVASDINEPALTDRALLQIEVREVNRAPQLVLPERISIREGETLSIQASAEDGDIPRNRLHYRLLSTTNPQLRIDSASGLITWNTTEADGGRQYPVEVQVSDNGSPPLTDTRTMLVEIREVDSPPIIESIPDFSIPEEQFWHYTVQVSDPDTGSEGSFRYAIDPLAISLGITIDDRGVLRWLPSEAHGPGLYPVTLTVTDSTDLDTHESFVIRVSEVNRPPRFTPIANVSARVGEPITVPFAAYDPDQPANQLRFSIDAISRDRGVRLDSAARTVTWTPQQAGSYPTTITVLDDGLPEQRDSINFIVSVDQQFLPPIFDPVSPQHIAEQTQLRFQLVANASSSQQQIRYRSIDEQPSGLSIDELSGVVTWTPREEDGPGNFRVRFAAYDQVRPELLTVIEVPIRVDEVNRQPRLSLPAEVFLEEGERLEITAMGTDPDYPLNALRFQFAGDLVLPAGLTINPQTGTFIWQTEEADGPAVWKVDVVLQDDGQPSMFDRQSIWIFVREKNEAPEIGHLEDLTIDEMTELVLPLDIRDPDVPKDHLTITLDEASIVRGMTLDADQRLRWTPDESAGPGSYPVTITVTDDADEPLSHQRSFIVHVREVNRPPRLDPIPAFSIRPGAEVRFTARGTDPDAPQNRLSYSLRGLAPPGSIFDSASGAFLWNAPRSTAPLLYNFWVRVSDDGGPSLYDEQPVTIEVLPETLLLREDDRFITAYEQRIELLPQVTHLRFQYSSLQFDTTDTQSMRDAFEAALLDDRGIPVAGIISPGFDAFLNQTEAQPLLLASGTNVEQQGDSVFVVVNVSHLPAGTVVRLVQRLVNNDQDDATSVLLYPGVEQRTEPSRFMPQLITPPPFAPSHGRSQAIDDPTWQQLEDVTDHVQIAYSHTASDTDSQSIGAGLRIINTGTFPLREPVLLVVSAIDLADASLRDLSGTIPATRTLLSQSIDRSLVGSPFYDLSPLLSTQTLDVGHAADVLLRFSNSSNSRFNYQLRLLSALNRPPTFVTTPPQSVRLGNHYRYPAQAIDPDEDLLDYRLHAGPAGLRVDAATGIVSWTPTQSDVGVHRVSISATDPYGLHDQQFFLIDVTADSLLNQPPRFVSEPIVDAYVGQAYQYPALAEDPDFDRILYQILDGPPHLTIPSEHAGPTAAASLIRWIPRHNDVGKTHTVIVQADDDRGGTAQQRYQIRVHPAPGNLPPQITTQPSLEFTLPIFDLPLPTGNVAPQAVRQLLGLGQEITIPVRVEVPPDVLLSTADVVIVVDESGSMSEQAWVASFIQSLDDELNRLGIGNNRYALIGYGSFLGNPRFVTEQKDYELIVYGPEQTVIDRQVIRSGVPAKPISLPQDGLYHLAATRYTPSANEPAEASVHPTEPLPIQYRASLQSNPVFARSGWGEYIGTLAAGSIDIPFTANAGDQFILDGLDGSDISLQIIDPEGAIAFHLTSVLQDAPPAIFRHGGTHQLRLQGLPGSPYQFRLLDPQDASVVSQPGIPRHGTLIDPDQWQLYSITTDQPALWMVDRLAPPGGGSPLMAASALYDILLIGPEGVLSSDTMSRGSFGELPQSSPKDLPFFRPIPGQNYQIGVRRSAASANLFEPIPFAFQVVELTADQPLAPLNQSISGSLPSAQAAQTYSVSLNANQLLDLVFPTSQGGPASWKFIDNQGWTIAEGPVRPGVAIAQLPIRQSGRYHLVIQGHFDSLVPAQYSLRFNTTTPASVPPLTGIAARLNEPIFGSFSQQQGLKYLVPLQQGDTIYPTILAPGGSGFQWQLRSPTGGLLFNTQQSSNPDPGIDSGRRNSASPIPITVPITGTYQLTLFPTLPTGNFAFQLSTQQHDLVLDTPQHTVVNASGSVKVFSYLGKAGESLNWTSETADQIFSDGPTAASRAATLRALGDLEDGYWGLDYGFKHLHLRPNASQQFILLTDEDRDPAQPMLSREVLAARFAASNPELHVIANTRLRESQSQTEINALGFQIDVDNDASPLRFFYADHHGEFTTSLASQYVALDAQGGTEADYIQLVAETGGTVWDIRKLRGSGIDGDHQRQSVIAALVSTLTESIARNAIIDLEIQPPGPAVEIGRAEIDGSNVTFPVTFRGDGDAWNFNFDFVDRRDPSILYGSIPAALAASYQYQFHAVDPDHDPIQYALIESSLDQGTIESLQQRFFFAPSEPGAYPFTLAASDPWGGQDLQNWIVHVSSRATTNQPPQLTPLTQVQVEIERPLETQLHGTDVDGDTVTYRLVADPETGVRPPLGMSIDPFRGTIQWTPRRNQLGLHTIHVQALDGRGGRAARSFTVDVIPPQTLVNSPPRFTASPPSTTVAGLQYRHTLGIVDEDQDPLQLALVWGPRGMVLDPQNQTLTWRPSTADIGDHLVILRVSDGQGGIALQEYTLTVVPQNDSPRFTSEPPRITARGGVWEYPLRAIDPNGDHVHFSIDPELIPAGVSLDPLRQSLRWIPQRAGTFAFTVNADDYRGGHASQEFVIQVVDRAAPYFLHAPVATWIVGQPSRLAIPIADSDPIETLALAIDGISLSLGMTLTPSTCPDSFPQCRQSFELSWLPLEVGITTVALTAFDQYGLQSQSHVTIEVIEPRSATNPPRFTSLPQGPIYRGIPWKYQPQAIDPDGEEVALSVETVLSADMQWDAATSTLLWHPSDTAQPQRILFSARDRSDTKGFQEVVLAPISRARVDQPQFLSLPLVDGSVGTRWTYKPRAVDSAGLEVRFSLDSASLSAGIEFDATTGTLTWLPHTPGQYPLTLTATNAFAETESQTFTLNISGRLNRLPRITSIPTGPSIVGIPWSYQPEAFDSDGDTLVFSLDASSREAGMNIDRRTGRITYLPTISRNLNATITIDDGFGGQVHQVFSLASIQRTFEQLRAAPTFTSQPTAPLWIDQPWTYLVTVAAPPSATIRYELDSLSLRRGARIDQETGRVHWTPASDEPLTMEITAHSSQETSAAQIFRLEPIRYNRPPEIVSRPYGPVTLGRLWDYKVLAQDADNSPITFLLDTQSAELGMRIDEQGHLRWTPSASGTYPVTITARDSWGLSTTQSFALIAVAPRSAPDTNPIFRTIPPEKIPLGRPFVYSPRGFDPGSIHTTGASIDSELDYELVTGPAGMAWDPAEEAISWLPQRLGSYQVSIKATGTAGRTSVQRFFIEVVPDANANRVPRFASVPPGPAASDLPYRYPIIVIDPDGEAIQLSLDAQSIARGMRLDSNSNLDWPNPLPGVYPVTITATDPWNHRAEQSFSLAVVDNAPPRFTSTPPKHAILDETLTYQLRAIDPNPSDQLSFGLETIPDGATFDVHTGFFRWTPELPGQYSVRFQATDSRGLSTSQTARWIVVDPAANQPPLILGRPRSKLQYGVPFFYQLSVQDEDPQRLSYQLISGPAGATLDPMGRFAWTPSASQITDGWPIEVHVRATDLYGAHDNVTWWFHVGQTLENEPPRIEGNPHPRALVSRTYSASLRGIDPDGDAILWSLASAPQGMSIDAVGKISWIPGEDQIGSHSVYVVAGDPLGSATSHTFSIEVRGTNSPPLLRGEPATLHRVGRLYEASFWAEDRDGDPIEFRFAPGAPSHGATLDPTSGLLLWTPMEQGVFDFLVVASDPLDHGSMMGFRVTIDAFGPNKSPEFRNTSPGVAEVGLLYQRAFPAVDPDGDRLTYSLLQGPPGMQIDSEGLVRWTPAQGSLNTHVDVHLRASDPAGNTARYSFRIPVRAANRPPVFLGDLFSEIDQGTVYQATVEYTDPDADVLTVTLVAAPPGATYDPLTARVVWPTETVAPGVYEFTTHLTDHRIAEPISRIWSVIVHPDTEAPTLAVRPDRTSGLLGEQIVVFVHAFDNVAVTERQATWNGAPVSLDSRGYGIITLESAGRFLLRGTAIDAARNQSSDQREIIVRDPADSPPRIQLASPQDLGTIVSPTLIRGSIEDPENQLVAWSVSLEAADPAILPVTLASHQSQSGNHLPAQLDTVLAELDTTTLPNGLYRLSITATDAAMNTSHRTIAVSIEGMLKLGSFSTRMVDLQLPSPGFPLTITRVYNSLDAGTLSDFGYGWSLEFSRKLLHIDHTTLGGVGRGRYPAFRTGTRVLVSLDDGTHARYVFDPIPISGFASDEVIFRPHFRSESPATPIKLLAPDHSLRLVGGQFLTQEGLAYHPADPEIGNFFRLVDRDGKEKVVNATSGILESISDLNGNRFDFTPHQITSNRGLTLAIQRDHRNRVVAIVDPRGQRMTYAYDHQDRLIAITDRVQNTLPDDDRKSVHIDYHGNSSSLLHRIVAADGSILVENRIDSHGRMTAVVDALGNPIESHFNVAARTQTLRVGDTVLSHQSFNDRGQLTSVQEPLDGSTELVYGNAGKPSLIARKLHDPTTGIVTETFPYSLELNDQGQVAARTSPDGNTSRFIYDPLTGKLLGQIDPLGNRTTYSFDDRGNLISIIDPKQQAINFVRDPMGNVIKATSIDLSEGSRGDCDQTLTMQLCFAERILFESVFDARGNEVLRQSPGGDTVRSFYDANNQLIQQFSQPTHDELRNVLQTSYDANDRPVQVVSLVRHADETTSDFRFASRQYDSAGRVQSELAERREVTHFSYDPAGRPTIAVHQMPTGEEMVTYKVFDPRGRVAVSTNPVPVGKTPTAGQRYHYDHTGQIIRTDSLVGLQINVSYSGSFASTDVIDEGLVLPGATAQPDALNHPRRIATDDGRSIDRIRDDLGRTIETKTTVRHPGGGVSVRIERTVYDQHGRILTATDPYSSSSADHEVTGIRYAWSTQGDILRTDRVSGLRIELLQRPDGTWQSHVLDPGLLLDHDRSQHDEAGRVTTRTEEDGTRLEFLYDGKGRQVARRVHPADSPESPSLTLTYYESAASENNSSIIHVQSMPQHALGRVPTKGTRIVRDAYGRTVRTELLDSLMIDLESRPGGRWESVLRSPGQVVASSTANYDSLGRIISRTTLDGGRYDYDYDVDGNLVTTTGPSYFDVALSSQARPRTEYSYQAARRTAETSGIRVLPSGAIDRSRAQTTSYHFDDQGRTIAQIFANGQSLRTVYDSLGRAIAKIDTAGGITQYEYDATGALRAIIQPLVQDPSLGSYHPRTEYQYDDWGNRLAASTGILQRPDGTLDYRNSRHVRDSYDSSQRLIASQRGDLPAETRTYDDRGRIEALFRSDGSVEAYDWSDDTLSPGLERTEYFQSIEDYITGVAADFTSNEQDSAGNVTQTFASGIMHRRVNAQGLLTALESPGGIIHYEYDPQGRIQAAVTYQSLGQAISHRVQYSYDFAGRLAAVVQTHRNGDSLGNRVAYQYFYDVFGRVSQIRHPDGMLEQYTYDSLGRIESISYRVGDSTPTNSYDNPLLAQFTSTFSPAGHRELIHESRWDPLHGSLLSERRLTLQHDPIGRLVRYTVDENATQTTIRYLYDAAHNRIQTDTDLNQDGLSDRVVRSVYDAADRLLHETTQIGGMDVVRNDYHYRAGDSAPHTRMHRDLIGNATLSETTYDYDLRGYLTAVEVSSSLGLGERTRTEFKRTPGGTIFSQRRLNWVDSQWNEESNLRVITDTTNPSGHSQWFEVIDEDTNNSVRQMIFGHRLLGEIIDDPFSDEALWSILADAQGSVRGSVVEGAAAPEWYDYGAFGETSAPRRPLHGYAGELHDMGTGLVELRQRSYTPSTGRFLQADKFSGVAMEPLSLHRYIYGSNAPFTYRDPSGNLFVLIDGTWNHDSYAHLQEGEDFTSIYRLRESYRITNTDNPIYLRGVGNKVDNGTLQSLVGGAFGAGMSALVAKAVELTESIFSQGVNTDIYIAGFSRGAIASLQYAHELQRRFPSSRIRHMLLLDPVGSIGFPGNGVNSGFNTSLARNIVSATSLIAWQEDRGFFPGTNIQGRRIRQSATFGVHGDVGGGYANAPQAMIRDSLAFAENTLMREGLLLSAQGRPCPLCTAADTHYPHPFATYLLHGGQTFGQLGRPMVEYPMPGELGMAFFAEEINLSRVGIQPEEARAAMALWIPMRTLQIESIYLTHSFSSASGIFGPLYLAWNLGALHASHIYYWVNRT